MIGRALRRIDSYITHRYQAQAAQAKADFASRTDSIINALTGMGGQYDKGAAAYVDTSRRAFTLPELDALFRFNGYAGRLIDVVAEDAARKGWRVVDSTDETEPLAEENKRLRIRAKVHRWIQLARKDGGCLLVIVTDDDDDPSQPLRPESLRRVSNLVVVERAEASVATWEGDPAEQDFQRARTWWISPTTPSFDGGFGDWQSGGASIQVHRSRVLYLGGRELPARLRYRNGGFDDSVLELYWDQIRNRTSVDQGGAILAQELKQAVVRIEGFDAVATSDQGDYLDMRMSRMAKAKSVLGILLMGKGDEYSEATANVSGYKDLDSSTRESLSAVTGLPQTKLWGQSPGGLNTDGDSHRRLWSNFIASFQANRLGEPLEYLYLLLFLAREGPTAGQEPEDWSLEFNPLDELSEQEQAELEKTTAETDAINVGMGAYDGAHVARSRHGSKGWQRDLLPVEAEEQEATPVLDLPALEGEAGEQDMPSPSVAGEDDVQKTALNGAQVTALADLVRSVVAAELPEESAVQIVVLSFRVSEAEARAMIRPAANTAQAVAEQPPVAPPEPSDEPPFAEPLEPAAE